MALSLSWDQVIHAKPLFGAFYCVLNIVNIIKCVRKRERDCRSAQKEMIGGGVGRTSRVRGMKTY